MARAISEPVVLLTGFGPFPGMPDNVSGRLVRAVAARARAAFPQHRFHSAILPTEWFAAPERVKALVARLTPKVALHFGVAREARGFRIETQGLNACRHAPDAIGQHPANSVLIANAPERFLTTLPVDAIVKRLRALDVPAAPSDDAGGYLCNAILYHVLHAIHAPEPATRAGFIHIPSAFTEPLLTFDAAVAGSLEIIAVALEAESALPAAPR